MRLSPLQHVMAFWKPLIDSSELDALGVFLEPGEPPRRGFNAVRSASEPRSYRIVEGASSYRIFAAVDPIDVCPASAEIVAEVLAASGEHHSYVLRFPDEGAVVVPFDPNEAIEAFWHEDYVPVSERTALPRPLMSLYYSIAKPLMPKALKRWLRRGMANRALASETSLDWPTDDSLDRLQRFLLRMMMGALGRTELEFVWFWPDRHPWAVVLTHDVETAAGLANAPHIAAIERARGLRSSFNIVIHDYETPDEVRAALTDGGFEIGVHGYIHDGLMFSNWETFLERVAKVNQYAKRWGAVGFRSPATWRNREWMARLEVEYDSSVSNTAPCEPQPGGCASFFPFPYGDGRLVELPITLPQDHTLFELLEKPGPGIWLACLARIEEAHGMACVLTHPDPAAGYTGVPANEEHYRRILDEVAASDAWTPLPRDLARWWRARATLSAADIDGASTGTAVLSGDGRLEIVPPSR